MQDQLDQGGQHVLSPMSGLDASRAQKRDLVCLQALRRGETRIGLAGPLGYLCLVLPI